MRPLQNFYQFAKQLIWVPTNCPPFLSFLFLRKTGAKLHQPVAEFKENLEYPRSQPRVEKVWGEDRYPCSLHSNTHAVFTLLIQPEVVEVQKYGVKTLTPVRYTLMCMLCPYLCIQPEVVEAQSRILANIVVCRVVKQPPRPCRQLKNLNWLDEMRQLSHEMVRFSKSLATIYQMLNLEQPLLRCRSQTVHTISEFRAHLFIKHKANKPFDPTPWTMDSSSYTRLELIGLFPKKSLDQDVLFVKKWLC